MLAAIEEMDTSVDVLAWNRHLKRFLRAARLRRAGRSSGRNNIRFDRNAERGLQRLMELSPLDRQLMAQIVFLLWGKRTCLHCRNQRIGRLQTFDQRGGDR